LAKKKTRLFFIDKCTDKDSVLTDHITEHNSFYCKTSNIIRTFLTIKLPAKSVVHIIHRPIFCRFISDWTIVENGKIIDYQNTGGAASA